MQVLEGQVLFSSSTLATAWKVYLLKLAQLKPLATLRVMSLTRM